MSGGYEIETWRDGYVVRTTVTCDGKEVSLPWFLDTITHRGARRKARRAIRRLESEANPHRERVPSDGHGGWRW